MPLGLLFSEDDARLVGVYVGMNLLPTLLNIQDRLTWIHDDIHGLPDMLQGRLDELIGLLTRLPSNVFFTYETNPRLLEYLSETRWGIARLDYNTMADIQITLWGMHATMRETNRLLGIVNTTLIDVTWDIYQLEWRILGVLEAILAQLQQGIRLTGEVVFRFRFNVGDIDWLEVLKLLGALFAGLAMLAVFIWAVVLALKTLGVTGIAAALAMAVMLWQLGELVKVLAGLSWPDVAKLGVALGALAVFVTALTSAFKDFNIWGIAAMLALSFFLMKLGEFVTLITSLSAGAIARLGTVLIGLGLFIDKIKEFATTLAAFGLGQVAALAVSLAALSGFLWVLGSMLEKLSGDAGKALGPLGEFIDKLKHLATTLANLDWGALARMAAGFLVLGGFVWVLARALGGLNAQTLEALPQLSAFIEQIAALGMRLSEMSVADLLTMGAGLLILAGFVYLLTLALGQLSDKALEAMPHLARFIEQLVSIARTLAALTIAEMLMIVAGLGAIVLFVYFLVQALNELAPTAAAAVPALGALIAQLLGLVNAFAAMSIGELIMVAVGLAIVAGFVWLLAAALVYAQGPLRILNSLLERLERIVDGVFGAVGKLVGGLGDLIDMLPGLDTLRDIGGSIFSPISISGLTAAAAPAAAPAAPSPTATTMAATIGGGGEAGTPPAVGGGAPGFGGAAGGPLAALGGLPAGLGVPGPGGGAAGGVDQSVNVEGGINVAVNADRLEANAGQMLSEEIIRGIQDRLGALRSEQGFRTGDRAQAPA